MPSNLLLLPFLAGYLFLHSFHFTKFRAQRLDGYRLLMESAAVGLVLALTGWVSAQHLATLPCIFGLVAENGAA